MRFLIGTDGSSDGLGAVNLGGKMAARMDAEVVLLCATNATRNVLDKALGRAAEAIEETGISFTDVARRGHLIDELLAQMLAVDYDLVIVGYQTRGRLDRMLWGSLAARIVHELPTSVLIVRDWREAINHILIGISGGGFTAECANWGGRIAAAFNARVTVLHASQAPALMYAGLEEVAESLQEFLQTDTLEARALRGAIDRLNALGVKVDVELIHGLPEREILRLTQSKDIDLLVVGSSWAANPMHRTLLKNVAEKVLLRTRRPVLVVRPAQA
jgi:nucleotide-binding universal stress UspA family protein